MEINFNQNWYFSKDAAGAACLKQEMPDSSFLSQMESVTLPHTWNAVDGQDGGNDYYRGTCVYAKQFDRPDIPEGGKALLRFDGAAMTADVWVNGKQLVHHEGGFSTFYADLTDILVDKDNLITVFVDNSANDRVYPQKADFTFYGGIYRNVVMEILQASYLDRESVYGYGCKVNPTVDAEKKTAKVELTAKVCGSGNLRYAIFAPVDCGLDFWKKWRIGFAPYAANGDVEKMLTFSAKPVADVTIGNASGEVAVTFPLTDIHLWNGKKDPYLYFAFAALYDEDGNLLDYRIEHFGLRTFFFDNEYGFFLNGESYPLRGVSRHQDRLGVGNALTHAMHEEDLDIICEMGANTIRLAHYQHAQYFYNLCDEAGIICWAEIPYITQHMPNGRANTLSQMRELISQCYNHACIICWGLSNEITASGSVTDDMMENHQLLNDLCHEMDPSRPTTMAHVFMLPIDSPIIDIPDISSYNLYYGWYVGELNENEEFFDEFHEKYPDRIIGFSEYGADANPQYQSDTPERSDYTESYQCLYHEHILECINARPYLWATHVWNMFDFAADGRDEGGKHGQNQKGLVTMDRKLRKDPFYLYKAYWSDEPFVHVCGSRYVDRVGDTALIKVYSNLPVITLFVDGRQAAIQSGSHIFNFTIPLTGEHRITAAGASGTNANSALTDTITIRKVETPNPDYSMMKKESVVNWFDRDSLDPTAFSLADTLGDICATESGKRLIGAMMAKASASRGDVAQSTAGNPVLQKMLNKMSVQSILKQAGDAISPEEIKMLNAALQKIKKPVK